MLEKQFSESEVVLGLVGAVGTDLQKVSGVLEDRLRISGYRVLTIRITKDILPGIISGVENGAPGDEYARVTSLMKAGNDARELSKDNSILALGAAAYIAATRVSDPPAQPKHSPKTAYIIHSLKHPEEVARLRAIYPEGFYLLGVHADESRRLAYLMGDKCIREEDQARKLMRRDEDEHLPHGQRVADTFHLSDFFVRIDGDEDRLKKSLWRLLALLFGHPFVTPTFDEYAMYMAFASALRSSDLSRQVGAVVAVDEQVVATGANECPKAGGGQYWPLADRLPEEITESEDGRDFVRGDDCNKVEQQRIIEEIVADMRRDGIDEKKALAAMRRSRINDLTEFGRMVHAEMEALLSCARTRVGTKGGTLYSTTFPCHNCAKHIVDAGIARVVFIEPYSKSKAIDFHPDSICFGIAGDPETAQERRKVHFEPFVGVGPRRFFDLFSMSLGSGRRLARKGADNRRVEWKPDASELRLQMLPATYLDLESLASKMFNAARDSAKGKVGAK